MKLFIDDLRSPYNSSWTLVTTYSDAIKALVDNCENITAISFDHDLACTDKEGKDLDGNALAQIVEEMCYAKRMLNLKMLIAHSGSPVGRDKLMATFEAIVKRKEASGGSVIAYRVVEYNPAFKELFEQL